jgi:2-(1,2-epoxy-1,2-dihydrophenyl)acetyl-CoA isomerase
MSTPAEGSPVLRYEVDGGLARITLSRPHASNAIDLELAEALMQAATDATEDPSIRAIVLSGDGPTFCVGGDLKSFGPKGADLPRHLKDVATALHVAVARLARHPAPVVAAVHGHAAGAGMSIACSADIVVAAESARFTLAYTRLGLSPDGSATWFLPRLIGLQRALDLVLTNRTLTAQDALEWGIVSRVVPDDRVADEATALAQALAAGALGANGAAKRLMRESLGNSLETQMELETLALAENGARYGAEGIAAFLAKRPAQFTP